MKFAKGFLLTILIALFFEDLYAQQDFYGDYSSYDNGNFDLKPDKTYSWSPTGICSNRKVQHDSGAYYIIGDTLFTLSENLFTNINKTFLITRLDSTLYYLTLIQDSISSNNDRVKLIKKSHYIEVSPGDFKKVQLGKKRRKNREPKYTA